MLRHGLLHADLAARVARLGHTDRVVVADRGLPVPAGVPLVDLALVPGQLPFVVVLDALLDQIVVQAHTIADEAIGSAAERLLAPRAPELGARRTVPHEEFKAALPGAAFVVRTGEETPYANVVLECGVPF